VTVVSTDGTQEVRDVLVGLTSRVAAEIISGLAEGEQVVAGVIQADTGAAPQQNQGPNIRIGGGFGGGFR
jgi:macrolide-specific efflux system membrane fusion protein